MATPTKVKNQDRVWRKILSVFQYYNVERAADLPVGAATAARIKRRVWVCAGTPSATATGMASGDFILDLTGDEVYRCTSAGTPTFDNMTPES